VPKTAEYECNSDSDESDHDVYETIAESTEEPEGTEAFETVAESIETIAETTADSF